MLDYAAIWRIWSVKPYVNVHHFEQIELGETHSNEPTGSFLMPLRHCTLMFLIGFWDIETEKI